jgi:hypothetical protein
MLMRVPSHLLSFASAALLGGVLGACSSGGAAGGGGSGGGGAGGTAPPVACSDTTATPAAVQLAEVIVRLTKNGSPWLPAPTLQLAGVDVALTPDENRPYWTGISDGQGNYSLSVPPGRYDVLMNGGRGLAGALATAVDVQRSTALVYDYQTVRVSGAVRFAGGPFPAENGTKGTLCLDGPGTISSFCAELPQDGTFALEVPRGDGYEMTWSRGGTVPSTAALSAIPYGTHVLGTRSFDQDTTLDLNVDAPTVVLSGRVSVDGAALPAAAQVLIGPVAVTMADASTSSFAVRMLPGSYMPMVFVETSSFIGYWSPCAGLGCALTGDTEWLIDIPTTALPSAVVEGTLDFVTPPGRLLALQPGAAAGIVTLARLSAPPEVDLGVHGGATSYQAPVDSSFRFRLERVAYGTYAVRFGGAWGAASAASPGGLFDVDGVLVVDRERVTWTGAVPLVPVIIDVKVNGRAMPDDSMLEGQPRGTLVLSLDGRPQSDDRFVLDFAERGPARFERLMAPGSYRVAVESWTNLGRTHRQGHKQDVLPVGQHDLGSIEVAGPGAGTVEPASFAFDLQVRSARLQIQGADLVRTTASGHTMLRLFNAEGNDLTWAEVPGDGGAITLPVYSGCYTLDVFGTDLGGYPAWSQFQRTTRLGGYCTCDQTRIFD